MADPAEFMTADDPSVSSQTPVALYGIYLKAKDGTSQLVLQPDSFIGYSYINESRLSQYPQEAGAFQQYNKVDTPFDVRVTMTKGGNVSDVASFLAIAESLPKATDLNLYDVITPERTYSSVNIARISHDHKPGHGANMVTIELYLTEIRVTASAQYANTTSPTSTGNLSNTKTQSGVDPKQGGTVQAQTVPASQQTTVNSALANAFLNAETIVP